MNNMSAKYSLLSLEEPTDDQLHIIMADALADVKQLNEKAKLKSQELFDKELKRINLLKKDSIFYKNGRK